MDERLKKNAAEGVRGDRAAADIDRTQKDGTATTVAERQAKLRELLVTNVLPTPPEIPGYRLCWLSTTNQQDPIYKRMQLGCEPVKASEAPGLGSLKITSGEFEGCVSVNEMLLFKLPEDMYQAIMALNHFERPNEEEQVLKANVTSFDHKDSDGTQLTDVEGFDNLGRRVRTPIFA